MGRPFKQPSVSHTSAQFAKLQAAARKLIITAKGTPTCHGKVMSWSSRTGALNVVGAAWVVGKIRFSCRTCQKSIERPMTALEIAAFTKIDKVEDERGRAVHALWHEFSRRFQDRSDPAKSGKWLLSGWAMMEKVEKWANRELRGIEVLRCDDSYHASSDLILIPHAVYIKGKVDYYWGTTVVYVPQCSGDPPAEFFLYGNHAKGFRDALDGVVKHHRQHGDPD
jgi:hypothetical protein